MRYDPCIPRSKDDKTRRAVIATDAFLQAQEKLEKSPEMIQAFTRLMLLVAAEPETGRLTEVDAFVMRNRDGWSIWPMIRIHYYMDDEEVRLLHVGVFDAIGAVV